MSALKAKLYAAAAAVAALASTDASAFPQLQNSATPDLTLVVWDTADNVTYFRDLGTTWSAATVGSDFASSLPSFTADQNWSRFVADIGGVSSTTFYDVVSGTLTPSVQILVSTGPNPLTPVKGGPLQTAINNWANFATNNFSTGSGSPNFNTATASNHGSNISVSGNPGEASSGTPLWQSGFGQQTFTTFANVGQAMNFFSMSGGNAIATATVTMLPGQWLLATDGTLTYTVSAVPEPQNWVLFAAGIGVIGVIARRRLRAF